MNREAQKYLEEIEMAEPAIARVETLLKWYSIYLDGMRDIFIADIYDGESIRRYLNLWIITDTLMVECKNFLISDNIDFTRLDDVNYIEINKSELETPFGPYTNKSVYNIGLRYDNPTIAIMMAAGNNCKYLHLLVVKYFLPALINKRRDQAAAPLRAALTEGTPGTPPPD
jgi:hypothetical protein